MPVNFNSFYLFYLIFFLRHFLKVLISEYVYILYLFLYGFIMVFSCSLPRITSYYMNVRTRIQKTF